MCGIWGFSLKTNGNRKIALQKYKILGLYNKSRGRDASGVFVNGEIFKGVGLLSEFDDFIEKTLIPLPKENGVMLGHARQGSFGYKKTIDEAHPFLINDDLVFSHNGTIKNIKELCKKYEKNPEDFSVDSQALGTLLDENGATILEEYIGSAALAFTRLSEPNVLYLYHGESKEFKHGKPIEERPLYYMETKDGVFYSSLEESLLAIKEDEKEVVEILQYNHIYKVHNGKFILDESIYINREEMNVSVYVYTEPVYSPNYSKAPGRSGGVTTKFDSGASIRDEHLIKRESLPARLIEAKDRTKVIYYHHGRYWVNLRKLAKGPVYIQKPGLLGDYDDNISKLFFFWDGVLLKDKMCFDELKRLNELTGERTWVKDPTIQNYALYLSKYSKYPIMNIGMEGTNVGHYYRIRWYFNGSECKSEAYTAMFSGGRNYKIEDGLLVRISGTQRDEKVYYPDSGFTYEELKTLTEGGILRRVPGGDSKVIPFLLPEKSDANLSENQNDDQELKYFFDVSPLTKENILTNIGKPEMKALEYYCRITYKNAWNLALLPLEIKDTINEILEAAIKKRCSILDMIDNDMDKQKLIYCYESILSEDIKESFQSDLPFKDEHEIYCEKKEKQNMLREQILEKTQECINYMEDLQQISMEFINEQDSDLSQDLGGMLITDVNNMLANFGAILIKHSESKLAEKIKQIRETKNLVDGTL